MDLRRSFGDTLYFIEDSLFFDPPMFFYLLNEDDKEGYKKLKKTLSEFKNSRGTSRKKTFIDQLLQVQRYVEKNDSDDWKRGLACGMIFLENSIAVNIQQFLKLFNKCKSSVNGLLQRIGFTAHPQGSQIEKELILKVPLFENEKSSVKKWTVRDCITEINPFRTVKYVNNNETDGIDSINVGTVAIEPRKIENMLVPIKFRRKALLDNRSIAVQT